MLSSPGVFYGERLELARNFKGLTQGALANEVSTSNASISYWRDWKAVFPAARCSSRHGAKCWDSSPSSSMSPSMTHSTMTNAVSAIVALLQSTLSAVRERSARWLDKSFCI